MKTTLIAPTPPDIAAFGTRSLSAYLTKHGKSVRVIFLPGGVEKYKYRSTYHYRYESKVIEQIIELCRGSQLIGISFMSNYLDRALQIGQAVKSALDVKLIVGGIHPTVMPEACLQFADIVCVGEGEESLLELIQRMEKDEDLHDIRNLYFKDGTDVIKNPLRPLIIDLDSLPHYDFGPDDHYVYDNLKQRIEPVTKDLLQRSFPLEPHVEGSFYDSYKRTLSYKTMTTRGCPHHCTFCAENTLRQLYKGQKYLRKRSISHIVQELLWVKQELPFVESIFIFDDTFLVRTNKEIREFSEEYKRHIQLPLHVQVSPATVTEEKISALVDAGLTFVEMGIQTTSQTGMSLYRRKTSKTEIFDAARIFNRFQDRIHPPCYHLILDNLWESTADKLETLKTVLQLPKPFWLKRASLVLFHGTALYQKAKEEGIIRSDKDEWDQIYSKHLHTPKGSYINFLFYIAGFSYFPRWIIRVMAQPVFIQLFESKKYSKSFQVLNRIGEGAIVLSKGIRSLATGDVGRIRRYFQKIFSNT